MIDRNILDEILIDVRQINQIIKSGVFAIENSRHPLLQSAFTQLMICLSDLLQKCKKYEVPVNFTDAVDITADVANVTDLVSSIRGAVCHITSKTHQAQEAGGKFTFNMVYGGGKFGEIGGFEVKSDFADDVCFFFGRRRIYLNRHIIRAFEEAKENLIPITGYPAHIFE